MENCAKENEQMEKEQREMASEAADAYMNGVIEDVHSPMRNLRGAFGRLEDGTMVHIIVR